MEDWAAAHNAGTLMWPKRKQTYSLQFFEKKPSITYSLSDAPAKLSKAALELCGLILAVLLLSSPHPVYT